MALCLVLVLLCRLLLSQVSKHWSTPLLVVGIGYCMVVAWRNELVSLRLYPVIVNAVMLLIFAWSLYAPPTIVERLARLQHPDLPAAGVLYTRQVTKVWCVFFIINGVLALITALWCSLTVWSWYNGLIAYLLMGMLMAGEYWVRLRTQRHGQ